MARFSFPSTRQIVLMTLLWVASLLSIDFWKNPRPLRDVWVKPGQHGPRTLIKAPHVSLWMNHMCCSGCLDEVRAALKTLPWVETVDTAKDKSLPEQELA